MFVDVLAIIAGYGEDTLMRLPKDPDTIIDPRREVDRRLGTGTERSVTFVLNDAPDKALSLAAAAVSLS